MISSVSHKTVNCRQTEGLLCVAELSDTLSICICGLYSMCTEGIVSYLAVL